MRVAAERAGHAFDQATSKHVRMPCGRLWWQALAYRDFLGDISPMRPRKPVMYKAWNLHVYQGQRHRNSHADAENTGTCIVGSEKIMDRRKDVNILKPIIYFFVINSSYSNTFRMNRWVLRSGCLAITISATGRQEFESLIYFFVTALISQITIKFNIPRVQP